MLYGFDDKVYMESRIRETVINMVDSEKSLILSTGVNGLDEMLSGGFPRGKTVLLCGGPGTGKTIFCLQYMMSAINRGEPCVYVSLEESLGDKIENALSFNWDIEKAVSERKLEILDIRMIPQSKGYAEPFDTRRGKLELGILKEIENLVEEISAEHVIIDPLTSITIHESRTGHKRFLISQIFDTIKRRNCTGVLTTEGLPTATNFSMELFLSDGVIFLEKDIQEFKLIKTIRIDKMRGMTFDDQPKRYLITNRGFAVFNKEAVIT